MHVMALDPIVQSSIFQGKISGGVSHMTIDTAVKSLILQEKHTSRVS